MLDKNGNHIKSIGKIHGSKKESASVFEADQTRRDNASRILSPDQINAKGKWKVSEALTTTLGGDQWSVPRPITADDLKALKANIKALGARLGKGITANEIIKLSRKEDLVRATKEIHFAVPVYQKGGLIKFMTNASEQSKDIRHHVNVFLEGYGAIKGQVGTPLQLAKLVAQGNLKFECDCGRHNFWFRFIVTRMGVNLGRDENGMPKIRNPMLTGIGCKHVLRVMTELNNSMQVHKKIAQAIEHDRKQSNKKNHKAVKLTQAEANKFADSQDKKRRAVVASDEVKAIRKIADKAPKPVKKIGNTKSSDKKDYMTEFLKLQKLMVVEGGDFTNEDVHFFVQERLGLIMPKNFKPPI